MDNSWGSDGKMEGLTFKSTAIFTSIFIIMNIKVYYLFI